MEDYKLDIIASRVGCVGSSDAQMLARIAREGKVPPSYARRLAVIKGIIPSADGVKTRAMEDGDRVEQAIFETLHASDKSYESNPRWESEEYKRKNVRLISHPDIVRYDEENNVLKVYEVKTTKSDLPATMERYLPQLYVHHVVGQEQADIFGASVQVFFVHYQTDGEGVDAFDAKNVRIEPVHFPNPLFDLGKAMDILDETLEDFIYEEQEDVEAETLPELMRTELARAVSYVEAIKDLEERMGEFKKKLYAYMDGNGIKNIKNDFFSVTRVDPSVSTSFDGKEFLAYIRRNDPQWADELEQRFKKETKRSGYALIKLK